MHVGILGPGRLGRSFAVLLDRAGHRVDLRGRGEIPRGDVVLLTVPDRALPAVAAALPPGRIVLHCSGACDVDVLRPHALAGSLHPLMTFPGPEVSLPDLTGVPAALAGHERAVAVGRTLADSLGMRPIEVPGDRRLYHAAAVMAGNFATVLLAEASRVLTRAGVDPSDAAGVLLPLALQSLHNAGAAPSGDVAATLTGPAVRGDVEVIAGHRDALDAAGLGSAAALYGALTERAEQLARERRGPPGSPSAGPVASASGPRRDGPDSA